MNRIKLSEGIIAIGGTEYDKAPLFSMKLANSLAKTENVLFLSYISYAEKIRHEIKRMDSFLEPNLFIQDDLKHYNIETFLQLIKQIKLYSIKTIFIDDIDECVGNEFNMETWFEERNESVLDAFRFLNENYGVRIIFNSTLRKSADIKPSLPDFCWNRKMISACNQMFIVLRIFSHGYTEDESGRSTENDIRILSVKNENCEDEEILLDNTEVNIYPKQ